VSKFVHRRVNFKVEDRIIFLFFSYAVHSLPGEIAAHEVYDVIGQRFQVVSPGLLVALVGVDAGVPCRSYQALGLPHLAVLVRFDVDVPLGQTEVDEIDRVALSTLADEKVGGLYVSVEESFVVYYLQSSHHLIYKQKSRLERKGPVSKI
jgi:hypothetical protein